jgi:hypothetical protein
MEVWKNRSDRKRERLVLVDGSLEIAPSPGQGTTPFARGPL